MPEQKENIRILKLIEIFKKNPKLPIVEGAKQVHISNSCATAVKQWVRSGCVGIFNHSNKTRKIYKTRNKSNKLVEVECLGSIHTTPYKFLSESKFIRLCPNCKNSRKTGISDEFDD